MFGWFLFVVFCFILAPTFSKKPYVKITGTGMMYTYSLFCTIIYAIMGNYLWLLIMGLCALIWYCYLEKDKKKYNLTWIESFKTFLRKGP